MARPRTARGQRSATCLLLGALVGVVALVGCSAYVARAQAAEHLAVIHDFDQSHIGDPMAKREVSTWAARARVSSHHRGSHRSDGHHRDARHRVSVVERRASETGARATAPPVAEASAALRASPPPRCGVGERNVEYWGDVVEANDPARKTATAAECCDRCAATRGCNLWVHCSVEDAGGEAAWCDGQCWLKRCDDPTEPPSHGRGPEVPWTSGTLMKDFDPTQTAEAKFHSSAGADVGDWTDAPGPRRVAIVTPRGRIRVNLKPEWHLGSVKYLQRLATEKGCEGSCHLYRVETGFLVQGTLSSFAVAANKKILRGPKIMERGEVGWAGGSAGPDFFVYLGKNPADWLGHDHTVWGVLADEESVTLADEIVGLPSHTPGGANTMRFLKEKMYFDVVPDDD